MTGHIAVLRERRIVPSQLPVEINWEHGVRTGWSLFATHLALGLARAGLDVRFPGAGDHEQIPATLLPSILRMILPGDRTEKRIAINGLGNHFPAPPLVPNRVHVALDVFEDTAIPEAGLERIKQFDHHIACSTWAQGVMRGYGIESQLWFQGFDDTLFHPAPRRRPNDGRFYIFSGGKLEFRKGQDIVVEAFKRFRETPDGKDAVLVTAWQNRWPATMASVWESGYVKGVPITRLGAQDIRAWLQANGIPAEAHIDLGMPSQAEFANAIRECDVALFPNRCEGATNMVLPEVMACGIPVIASQNTGHLDSAPPPYAIPLMTQRPVTLKCPLFNGMDGWGESDPGECVEALRLVRRGHPDPDGMLWRAPIHAAVTFGWSNQAPKFAAILAGFA